MQRWSITRSFMLLAMSILLFGCTNSPAARNLLDDKFSNSEGSQKGIWLRKKNADRSITLEQGSNDSRFKGLLQEGNDQLVGKPIRRSNDGIEDAAGALELNLVDAPVKAAAKAVLSDTLGLSYSVDPRVTTTITLQTSEPVDGEQLLEMFENALADAGAGMVRQNKGVRIVPIEDARKSVAALQTGDVENGVPGTTPYLIQLQYVSAQEIQNILEPMVPAGSILRVDTQRNALIVVGNAQQLKSIKETVSVFDVDWMKGMSFALVPVKSSAPSAIVQDLEQVFDTKNGSSRGIVRFVPNNRLRSVLVVSSRSKYLREATKWIKKLDVLSATNEESLNVYHVQNRGAAELAKILTQIVSNGAVGSAKNSVAPKFRQVETADAGFATSGPETPSSGLDIQQPEVLGPGDVGEFRAVEETSEKVSSTIRIVADDANNSLLIFANQYEFDRIKRVLEEIDTVPNQVLLEAVIAEVSLDDDMRFGVRWFLGSENNKSTFSDALNGAASSVFPGFSYFLKSANIGIALNALSSVTDVRVLSSPSLLVVDNKSATLQVGDQVPIVTQSAKAVVAGDAPVVSSIELKDTGVILNVTPRVNDNGLVTLDIEQEVSSVVRTTTSGIDSPTIRQRKMKTSVVVSDGDALALGGLIQERETTGKSKVPVLGDIPILGAAFRNKTNAISRTELVIFIRPRVIRDENEARQITEEFRRELRVQAPRVRREETTPQDELVRILN